MFKEYEYSRTKQKPVLHYQLSGEQQKVVTAIDEDAVGKSRAGVVAASMVPVSLRNAG